MAGQPASQPRRVEVGMARPLGIARGMARDDGRGGGAAAIADAAAAATATATGPGCDRAGWLGLGLGLGLAGAGGLGRLGLGRARRTGQRAAAGGEWWPTSTQGGTAALQLPRGWEVGGRGVRRRRRRKDEEEGGGGGGRTRRRPWRRRTLIERARARRRDHNRPRCMGAVGGRGRDGEAHDTSTNDGGTGPRKKKNAAFIINSGRPLRAPQLASAQLRGEKRSFFLSSSGVTTAGGRKLMVWSL